tara:strand:- start:799 stop:2385 length:1587 start_codon:yes stop_codon:yes gene_type:complete
MKKFKSIILTVALSLVFFACEQEVTELKPNPYSPSSPTGQSGSADFSKFVSIGGAYVAGFGDGGLLHSGLQPYSVGRMVAVQLAKAGGSSTFVQPDINSPNGYFGPGADGVPGTADDEGRWYLTISASTGAIGVGRAEGDFASVTTPYAGDMTKIQNFAVGKQTMGQFLIPNDGTVAPLNPYFARFDASGGTKSALEQMIGTGSSFFLAQLGTYDFLAHYARGGDPNVFPEPTASAYGPQFEQALVSMLTNNPTWKGVVGTVPDVLASPFFQMVGDPSALVPLDATDDAATIGLLGQLSGGVNILLDQAVASQFITAEEAAGRTLGWSAGVNPLLVEDESLTDLGPFFDAVQAQGGMDAAQRAQLVPYEQARMARSGEIIHLLGGTMIGTTPTADPTLVLGITLPMPDVAFLTGAELVHIETQRAIFNGAIKQAVATHGNGRVAVADFDGFFQALAGASPFTMNNSIITYDFAPPTGLWSADGLLPNGRGYTLMANKFIAAINETFGATVPEGNPADAPGPGFPVTVD